MARHSKPQHLLAHPAAQRFITALRQGDSILTPEILSWAPKAIDQIGNGAMAELDGSLVTDQALNMKHQDGIASKPIPTSLNPAAP